MLQFEKTTGHDQAPSMLEQAWRPTSTRDRDAVLRKRPATWQTNRVGEGAHEADPCKGPQRAHIVKALSRVNFGVVNSLINVVFKKQFDEAERL